MKGILPLLSGALIQSGAGHALAQAAFLDKRLLELPELAIKQVGGHLDQADNYIGSNGRIMMLNAFAKGIVVGARLPV